MNGLPACVRVVNLSGEALQLSLVQRIYEHTNVQKVFNLYGASEATTYSSFSFIERGSTDSITLGRPIANTQIYLLHENLELALPGEPAEVCIGGAGIARGYLKRPELTAERFIPNPFSTEPNDRLYKTGDRACYLQNGSIEYIGRFDHQVKVCGYRIELGEIESVLIQYPGVADVVAVAREDSPGDKRLVAYVVPHFELTPTLGELRRWVKGRLPEYMVPDTFVLLDTLPLTPNGKIDRRSLPPPGIGRSELERDFVAPRTPVEEILAKIWSEVLGLERVGIHTDFFELGGRSLLATQVISRVREVFHVELPLRTIFETPTIASIAELILQYQARTTSKNCTEPSSERIQPKDVPSEIAQLTDNELDTLLRERLQRRRGIK